MNLRYMMEINSVKCGGGSGREKVGPMKAGAVKS